MRLFLLPTGGFLCIITKGRNENLGVGKLWITLPTPLFSQIGASFEQFCLKVECE